MHHRSVVELVYIKEQSIGNDIEITKEVKADIRDVFSNKYYNNLNRGIELTNVIKVRDYHRKPQDGSHLRYAIVGDERFLITNIKESNTGKYIYIDLAKEM